MPKHTLPKTSALPGCATPRPAEALRFRAVRGQAPKAVRGKKGRNVARTGSGCPEIVPRPESGPRRCDNTDPALTITNVGGSHG